MGAGKDCTCYCSSGQPKPSTAARGRQKCAASKGKPFSKCIFRREEAPFPHTKPVPGQNVDLKHAQKIIPPHQASLWIGHGFKTCPKSVLKSVHLSLLSTLPLRLHLHTVRMSVPATNCCARIFGISAPVLETHPQPTPSSAHQDSCS